MFHVFVNPSDDMYIMNIVYIVSIIDGPNNLKELTFKMFIFLFTHTRA